VTVRTALMRDTKANAARSPRTLVGMTTGALAFTCLSAIRGVQGPWIMLVITPIVTLALLTFGVVTSHAARWLLRQETLQKRSLHEQINRRFGIVVAGETTAIAAAVAFLRLINRPEHLAAGIWLIVGLQFLHRASLLQVRVYTLVGVTQSLLKGGLLATLFGLALNSR
jgi:hypothetical protein